ncbi:sodium:calcium antiporter [Tundrisphaera sp. TA3]|uniref:sodium:calcium antiporter n=1 Tax=Tundrisphaera sp. TA3 TaxID=3435775 RepID=UPI003EBA49C1
MLLPILLMATGLPLLVAGGEALLRGAVGLASLSRLAPAAIGLVVVGAGTAFPELAVSAIAAARGHTDVAVAHVVGSHLLNSTLILGAAALIRPLEIAGPAVRLQYPILVLATLLYLTVADDGLLARMDAFLFLACYAATCAYLGVLVRDRIGPGECRGVEAGVGEIRDALPRASRSWVGGVALACLGMALLAAGAGCFLAGAVQVGKMWALRERVIGLSIVALGTGLPELVTVLVSRFRGRDDLAISTVIGSNLFSLLGTLGLTSLVDPLPVPLGLMAWDHFWMLGVTLLLFPILCGGRRVSRAEGLTLVATYGVYLGMLLTRDINHEAAAVGS